MLDTDEPGISDVAAAYAGREALSAAGSLLDAALVHQRRALADLDREFNQIPVRDALALQAISTNDGVERASMLLRDLQMQVQRRAATTAEIQAAMRRRLETALPRAETPDFWVAYDQMVERNALAVRQVEASQRAYVEAISGVVSFMATGPAVVYEGEALRFYDPAAEAEFTARTQRVLECVEGLEHAALNQARELRAEASVAVTAAEPK